MDGGTYYTIGDLARRTGLTVKAIRFYSDRGIVPPADRSPAGYRRYGADAAARLDLVRTLRDLGLGLATIRKVVDREVTLPEVAAAHAEALAVQIRLLRTRRAVLTAVARRGSSPEEMEVIHKLATLSADERQRLVDEFLDSVFAGRRDDPGLAGIARTMTPELPDEPDDAQVEAWIRLAELSRDPDFRAVLRRTAEQHAADQPAASPPRRDVVAVVRDQAGSAVAAGVDPAAPEAGAIVAAIVAWYADACDLPDGADLRQRLLTRLETANDPRRERYVELLSVVNGWPAPETLTAVLGWFTTALHATLPASLIKGDSWL
ncbi:MerR family transcriptional regulator [Actinomycetes bacterium KLBMP 9797]